MKSDMRKVWVHCYQRSTRIASYDFGVGIPADPSEMKLPSNESLVNQAKTFLTNERLAFPPYHGIRFEVRWDHPGPS